MKDSLNTQLLMKITQNQVHEFARWTGDCNPIHVDPVAAKDSAFGGNICHGMLVLIESLSGANLDLLQFPSPLASVDVQFRSEVRPDAESQVHFSENESGFDGKVTHKSALQMEVAIRWRDPAPNAISTQEQIQSFSWMHSAKSSGIVTSIHEQPAPWTIDDFSPGQEILGVHRFASHRPAANSKFSLVQEQVFGLCSFIVGMRVPGLSSLFTKLKAQFVAEPPATEELLYRLILRSYDDNFRILEMQLDVATGDLQPVATCQIECYVRFPKLDPKIANYKGDVSESERQSMSGKIALICGASRGLGAEIAAALASVDCAVYLASRTRSRTTDLLVEQIEQLGGQVHVLLGDVGDPTWCESTAQWIEKNHGRLDQLVLNACELPLLKTIAESNPTDSADYIQRNIALFQQPLMHFLGLLKAANGTLVAISSSAVEEIPAGFGDYISVKLALEGSVRTLAKEVPSIRCVVVRPPQLQTAWNDTPIRAVGSVSVGAVASEILATVCKSTWEKNLQWITKFSKRKRIKKKPENVTELPLVASFTLDPIDQAFEGWSQVLELDIQPKIAPYAQILQQALDPASIASKSTSGSVFLFRIEDWFHELPDNVLKSPDHVTEILNKSVHELAQAIQSHRAMAKGPTLLLLCPSFVEPNIASLFAEAERKLQSALGNLAGLTFWNAESFHQRYGIDDLAFQDPLRNTIGHIPYIDPYYDFLATLCIRHLQRRLEPPKKVIVLDCDNTLWRGVVGELGPEGIGFDPVHHRLHRELVNLAQGGMLLCLCSKNEPDDVWAVFDQRKDFGLRREHIVASKINWMPKGQNIQDLAHSLNLGLDSFVFLDDNPVECAEVRANCPTVLTLQWYHDNRMANQLLDHLWELDMHSATKEDRERTRMYREEFQRQEVQASAANFQAFIDSLQLVVDFTEVTEEHVARASQLTLRTNQFNFTTVRRNESEILDLTRDPNIDMRIVQVRDRFGDYGIVGLIITKADASDYFVDTFLLSCRVLGRGVEHRIASHIASLAKSRGYSEVRWIYKPTEKNSPARLFLQSIANQGELLAQPTEIRIPAESLKDIKFQADQSTEPVEETQSKTSQPIAAAASKKRSTRVREEQIRRSVEEFANWQNISKSFRGGSQSASLGQISDLDVESQVLETFSKVLGIESEKVQSVDRLDALGCDSLQIVGITVSLTKVFPDLPPTLLFEYRSVSEIIEQIKKLHEPTKASTAREVPAGATASLQTDSHENRLNDAIAIVGIGLRCAAGDDANSLWKALASRESMVQSLPTKRDGFVGPMDYPHPYYAALISDVTGFDPEFFGISPREAQYMDPQMRLVLQSAWHALEDSGSWRENLDRSMGVFVGVMYQCYGRLANQFATETSSVYRCWEGFSVANRLSQILGVSGPSLAIDTACSSSATALHYAVQSLRNNECSSALIAGVNLILDPARIAQLDNLGILTRTGKCVPFGDQADGTVIGEGAVAIVIKRLSDAVENSDRIYAVIKGTGLSVGAGSVGFTAPNPVSQSLAIRAALADAHVDPRTIGYVETHGTGTQLGDPIEVRGLELAYCDRSLWDDDLECQAHTGIGSIKPNIGHLEAGAGLVGVVKAALQLHHKTLLPSITSEKPNPQIPFEKLPFKIQRHAADWAPLEALRKSSQSTETLPRRAAVNSFGVGGSNAHIILEEAPNIQTQDAGVERSSHLLVLQAPDPKSLQLQAARWSEFLQEQTEQTIGDSVYSNVDGHKNFEYRAAVLIDDLASASIQLDRWSLANLDLNAASPENESLLWGSALWKKSNRVAYLFTGQGAQYPGMLEQLYLENPVFKHAIHECSEHVDPLLQNSIRRILFEKNPDATLIHQTRFTQPSMFVVQYGLFKLWESYGIKPDALLGHSIGEIAAYCVSGGCSLSDALGLVCSRGELMQRLDAGGGMTSVAAPADTVESLIAELRLDLSIAAYNGPNQTVVSGLLEPLSRFADRATAAGFKTQPLKVSHAFHSKLMDPMLDEFRSVVSKLDLGVPSIELISTVTGRLVRDELANPDYWVDQVRKPVRFMQAMETLTSDAVSHFIEIGPHPVLLTMARAMELPGTLDSTRWLSSARRGQKDWCVFLESIAQMVVDGYRIDWKSAERPYARQRVSVPGFEFSNRRIWLDEIYSLPSQRTSTPAADEPIQANRSEHRLLYKTCWTRCADFERGITRQVQPGQIKSWLVLSMGDGRLAKGLESQLHNAGCSVQHFGWDAEKSQWSVSGEELQAAERIVWIADEQLTDGKETHIASASDIQKLCEEQLLAFSKALELVRSVERKDGSSGDKKRVFWLITQGAGLIGKAPGLTPIASALWGAARVASIELAEYWGGAMDLNGPIGPAIALIGNQPSEDQLIFLGDEVWVPRLQRLHIDAKIPRALLGKNVLITGGLGAIGMRFAQYAVSQGAKHLVLVGRNAKPSDEQQELLERWKKQGVSLQLVSADVSSDEGIANLTNALKDREIHTVFHTAGIDFLAPIAQWSAEDIRRVTQIKIQGTWGLHQWSLSQPIRQFVLTSSISSVWGAPQRFLYAAANAFLDALGDLRVKMNLPVTVINFGPWSDGGMADPASLEEYRRVGMHGLDPTETMEAIDTVLGMGQAQAVITDTQWERFVSVMAARRVRPFFDTVLSQEDAPDLNQMPKGDRLVQAPAASQPWLKHLAPLDKDKQSKELKSLLRKELSEILKSQEERIGTDKNLYRMGLDSITAVELSMRIKRGTGLAPGKWLVGEPTIESLSADLLENLPSNWKSRDTESQQRLAPQRPQAPWALELAGIAGSDERREHLMVLFRRELERYVGKSAVHLVSVSRIPDLGLDSLGAVDFATQLRKQLGLKSPPRLMQFDTVGDWVESVLGLLDQGTLSASNGLMTSNESTSSEFIPKPSDRVTQRIEVVTYEASHQAMVYDFIAHAWPHRNKEVQSRRWEWMYVDSARRLQTQPMVWLAKDQEKIVGHMGVQFMKLKLPNHELLTGWFVDTMVLEDYRTTGLGAQILLRAEEDMPMALSLGQTAEARKMLESLGWKKVCPLRIHVFMNNPYRVLRGKFPPGIDRLAATYFGWNSSRKRALQASRNQLIPTRRIERFGETHDALWNRMRQDVSCLAVRDSDFLNWKYLDQPDQTYDCWEVLQNERIIGILVTKTESESKAYPYRRLHWVDLVCDLSAKTLDSVIGACIAKSQEQGVDAISIHMTNKRIEEKLVQHGFVQRPETRYLYASRGLVESHPNFAHQEWMVTLGDSDIDRPQ